MYILSKKQKKKEAEMYGDLDWTTWIQWLIQVLSPFLMKIWNVWWFWLDRMNQLLELKPTSFFSCLLFILCHFLDFPLCFSFLVFHSFEFQPLFKYSHNLQILHCLCIVASVLSRYWKPDISRPCKRFTCIIMSIHQNSLLACLFCPFLVIECLRWLKAWNNNRD